MNDSTRLSSITQPTCRPPIPSPPQNYHCHASTTALHRFSRRPDIFRRSLSHAMIQQLWSNLLDLSRSTRHRRFRWRIKSQVFPDNQLEEPSTLSFGLVIFLTLALYWICPFIISPTQVTAPKLLMYISMVMYIGGMIGHYGSDAQR